MQLAVTLLQMTGALAKNSFSATAHAPTSMTAVSRPAVLTLHATNHHHLLTQVFVQVTEYTRFTATQLAERLQQGAGQTLQAALQMLTATWWIPAQTGQ